MRQAFHIIDTSGGLPTYFVRKVIPRQFPSSLSKCIVFGKRR
jgi:hypothetical protein